MNKKLKWAILPLLWIASAQFCFAQCKQSHPNSLFSIKTFLSFTGSFDESERKLLSWDFCLAEVSKSKSGEITYYQYRLDHTANVQRNAYFHDLFVLIKGSDNAFTYQTSSNKNYSAYFTNLINFGFQKTSDDKYKKAIGNYTYYLEVERSVHEDGTPNYRIFVFRE
jgi:hypothetical protein